MKGQRGLRAGGLMLLYKLESSLLTSSVISGNLLDVSSARNINDQPSTGELVAEYSRG